MAQAREKFATQVDAEILSAIRMIGKREGRQLQALMDEALADLIDKRKQARPRPPVMAAYLASHDKYGELYKNLSMDDRIFHLFADGPAPVAPYSHAVSVGDWIFVTGQIATGRDGEPIPESIEDQTHKVMANLKTVLAGCGAGLEHAVSVRIFLTRFEEEYDAMNAVYETYFPADKRPARTTVGVTALARGCRVEIDLIAKRNA